MPPPLWMFLSYVALFLSQLLSFLLFTPIQRCAYSMIICISIITLIFSLHNFSLVIIIAIVYDNLFHFISIIKHGTVSNLVKATCLVLKLMWVSVRDCILVEFRKFWLQEVSRMADVSQLSQTINSILNAKKICEWLTKSLNRQENLAVLCFFAASLYTLVIFP